MKKNWFMRIAGIMLALAMITSCFVGSTFAKYVTEATGADSARVARFGVLLGMETDKVFLPEYQKDDQTYNGTVTVQAKVNTDNTQDDVVAPGTTNTFNATVIGTPEVAVRYSIMIPAEGFGDVCLPAGTYTDYTQFVEKPAENEFGTNGYMAMPAGVDYDDLPAYGYYKVFTLANDYCPVKWDIAVTNQYDNSIRLTDVANEFLGDAGLPTGFTFNGFSANATKAIVERYGSALVNMIIQQHIVADAVGGGVNVTSDGYEIYLDFQPGAEMDYTFALTWKWNFEGGILDILGGHSVAPVVFMPEEVDAADTYLGNYMAYIHAGEVYEHNYIGGLWQYDVQEITEGEISVDVFATFTATATQID